jgi:hypothetical protein
MILREGFDFYFSFLLFPNLYVDMMLNDTLDAGSVVQNIPVSLVRDSKMKSNKYLFITRKTIRVRCATIPAN